MSITNFNYPTPIRFGAGAAGSVVNVIVVVARGVPVRLRIADGPPVRVNRYSVPASSVSAAPPKGLTSNRLFDV